MIWRIAVVVVLAGTALAHRTLVQAQEEARARPEVTLDVVPDRIGGFQQMGTDIEVEQRVFDLLDTPHVLMRNYVSRFGMPVQLTIVYTGENRSSLHFPEVCLTGQGWEIREQYTAPVGVFFVGKRLVLFRGDAEEAVLYWFKTGDYLTGSYFLNSAYWAREQLLFNGVGSMMVKVSTPIGPMGPEPSFQVLDEFAGALTPILTDEFE